MTNIVEATLEIDDIEAPIEVLEYAGREAIGELFEFTLTVAAREPLDVDAFIAGRAVLHFSLGREPLRAIEGVISHCVDLLSTETDHCLYRLRLVPMLWRSTLVELIDIYLDMDVRALVEHKLALVDLKLGTDFELRLTESYPEREFVVQYQENDAHFLARQLEHEGISFFFEHHEDTEVLVLGDHNAAFSPIGEGTVPFHARGERLGVFELTHATGMIPSHYVQRDYNYRQPDRDLTADVAVTGPGRAGGFYEYGSHLKTQEEANRIATVRAQERACRQRTLEGRSVLPQLRAGGRTSVVGHPRGDLELIITAVEHRGVQGFFAKEGATYENRFEAIRPDETFRPRRITPKPRITGLLTGIVETASDSDYADVDDQGRYRVRFLFDTAAPGERQASRPVRMMQPHAGPGYGMHFPLRGGVEVLIAFVGGDPDRPIIAGTMPNPRTPSPVTQSNRERNVIRTGAGNEINIDDTDGEERIKISTPRSGATLQLGAPNLPEDGAVLQSSTSVTNAATGSFNQFGAFTNSWSLWNSLWGNHVTAVAGKVMFLDVVKYSIDTVRGSLGQVSSYLGIALAVADTALHFHEKEVEKAQEELDEAEATLAERTPASQTPDQALEEKRTALAAEIAALDLESLDADDKQRIEDEITAYQSAQTALEERRDELAAAETALAETVPTKRQEIAVLEAQRQAAIEAGDEAAADAIATQIESLESDIEAAETTLKDAKKAVADATDDRDEALATLDEDLRSTAADDPTSLDLTSYDAAKSDYDVYYEAVRKVDRKKKNLADKQQAFKNHENGWKGPNDAKGYIDDVLLPAFDSAVGIPYSWVSTILGTGMGGYAAACTNVMLDEARYQREGTMPLVMTVGKSPWGGYGRAAPPVPSDPRTNAGWGALSRIEWLLDDRTGAPTDTDTAEYYKVNTRGGGASFMTAFKKPWQAVVAAGLTTLFGPIAGAFVFQFFKKSAAFDESRNIQGSEQKAVLFGKESVFVSGQEYATVSSGKKLLMTSNDEAILHTRGAAEVVGIDSLYLASAKSVDILSRGTLDLKVNDRGGGDDVGNDGVVARMWMNATPQQPDIPLQYIPGPPFVPTPAGQMAGGILLQTFENTAVPTWLSAVDLHGQNATISVNGAGQHTDGKLRLECHQGGVLQSYLELSETANTKTAKVLGGAFGLEADGGNAAFAKLTSGPLEAKVTATEVKLGSPDGGSQVTVTPGGATEIRGDTTLDLGAPNAINLVSGTIEFGGAAINQVNLTVKEGPPTQVANLRTLIQQAKAAGDQADQKAQQALSKVKKEASSRRRDIAKVEKELEKKQDKA